MPNSAMLVQALLAAFCAILCAGFSPLSEMGGGGMSLIMRRNLMAAKSGYTAKDYVQDGLIAMWDGIENAGWGVHDPNATVWKDLTGEYGDMELIGSPVWLDDCLRLNELGDGAYLITSRNYRTVEIVFKKENNSYAIFIGILNCQNIIRIENYVTQGNSNGNTNNIMARCDFNNRISVSSIKEAGFNITSELFVNGLVKNDGLYNDYWGLSSHDGIGLGASKVSTYLSRFMKGEFCACRLYSKDLTHAEIAANYAVDKARFNLPLIAS